eukprot:9415646-Pyramimonas_sp.AAC.1
MTNPKNCPTRLRLSPCHLVLSALKQDSITATNRNALIGPPCFTPLVKQKERGSAPAATVAVRSAHSFRSSPM